MRTKNRMLLAAGAAAVIGLGTLGALAQGRPLVVVSWGGAYQDVQRKVYFEPAKQAGVNLVDESWDGGIGVLRAKVQGGGDPGWDVVQVESEELEIGCDEGLFLELDYARIGGKDRYIDSAVHPCGVGAIVYNFVLGYDRDKLKEAPKGWADFFDTRKIPGKRALRRGPKTNLEIALIADGVKPADVYKTLATEEGVERAFRKLGSIKKDLVFWEAGAQPVQLLASGDVAMTSVYNGRVDAANRTDKRNFGIVWDGSLFTVDSWVILKGSPKVEEAYRLLDLIGDAKRQAALTGGIAYGVSNKDAAPSIDPKRLAELPIAPENMKNATELSAEFWLANLDRLNERFNRWATTN